MKKDNKKPNYAFLMNFLEGENRKQSQDVLLTENLPSNKKFACREVCGVRALR